MRAWSAIPAYNLTGENHAVFSSPRPRPTDPRCTDPRAAAAVECWVLLTDPHQSAHTIFSYAVDDPGGEFVTGGASYEQENELMLSLWGGRYEVKVRGSGAVCDSDMCAEAASVNGNWQHLAATREWPNGRVRMFINGTLVHEEVGDAYTQPIATGGVVVIGHDQDGLCSYFDEVSRGALRPRVTRALRPAPSDPRPCPPAETIAQRSRR